MTNTGVPEQGDICWMTLDPTKGHEQAGRRPVLVISATPFNALGGLVKVVPITNGGTGPYAGFGVPIEPQWKMKTTGTALCAQDRSVDRKARQLEFIEKAHPDFLDDVMARVAVIVGL